MIHSTQAPSWLPHSLSTIGKPITVSTAANLRFKATACLVILASIALPQPAQAATLASWDDFADTASAYAADAILPGFSASFTGGNSVNASFGSTDGTFGTVSGATATVDGSILVSASTSLTLTITLTNNTGIGYYVDSFHFDFGPRDSDSTAGNNNAGPNAFTLTYASGGLAPAATPIDSKTGLARIVFAAQDTAGEGNYHDFDYALADDLSDTLLGSGESAVFTLVFSGTESSGQSVSSIVDNILFTGSLVPEPGSLALACAGVCMILARRRGHPQGAQP